MRLKAINKDFLSFFFIFLWCLILITFQAGRLTPLVDWSYITENAYRLNLGLKPYLDIGLVLTPGTFIVQSWIQKIGFDYSFLQRIYIIIQSTITLFLSYKVLESFNLPFRSNILFLIPGLFGSGILYPFPFYDHDVVFFVTISLWLITTSFSKRDFLLGVLSWVPLLFKQSSGLGFLAATHALFMIQIFESKKISLKSLQFFLGSLLGLSLVLFVFDFYVGLEGWRHILDWTFKIPKALRGGMGSKIFRDFLSPTVFLVVSAFLILLFRKKTKLNFLLYLAPIVFSLSFVYRASMPGHGLRYHGYSWWIVIIIITVLIFIQLLRTQDYFSSSQFKIYFLILGAILANSASQGLSGSSYAFWGCYSILLGILLKETLSICSHHSFAKNWIVALAIGVASGSILGVWFNSRLVSFVNSDGLNTQGKSYGIQYLKTPGNWLSDLDNLAIYVEKNIPLSQLIHVIPGEDPFYFVTKRRPPLGIFQMVRVVFPDEPIDIYSKLRSQNIPWVIVKDHTQIHEYYKKEELLELVKQGYEKFETIGNYSIYKNKGITR